MSSDNQTTLATEYDLTNCEREPIHLLGRVQHGSTLMVFSSDWLLTAFSENLVEYFKKEKSELIGLPSSKLLSVSASERILDAVSNLTLPDQVERIHQVALFGGQNLFDVAIHFSGANLIVEFERAEAALTSDRIQALRRSMQSFGQSDGVNGLCQSAAQSIGQMTKFDRVMVYRFHGDDSGEVIAEHRNSDVDSFLGLRYPASDIPAQARALYKRSLTRLISDVQATGIPIFPVTTELDLSLSMSRAVSPIHLEYLKNMGIGASFSISILVEGKLWGLFACHHHSPRHLGFELRAFCELFAESFSFELSSRLRDQNYIASDAVGQLNRLMMASLNTTKPLFDNLKQHATYLKSLISCDALVISMEGARYCIGDQISSEDISLVLAQLNSQSTPSVVAIPSLREWLPSGLTVGERFAGVLAIPISRRPRDMLLYVRREEAQTITWAGNPEKPVELGPNGARLTPRKSFAAWELLQRGHCREWLPSEIALAEKLKQLLLELIVRNLDERNRIIREGQEQQDILIHELNHRVRNMLGLINSIILQTKTDDGVEVFKDVLSGRVKALAVAQTMLTERNWDSPPFELILENEFDAMVSDMGRVNYAGPKITLTPKAFTSLTLLFHELITNAAKYGALSVTGGRVNVRWHLDRFDDLIIDWEESGVTIDSSPTRTGFGSLIIERTVPFDLGGEAKREFARHGFNAHFVVPKEHFHTDETGEGISHGEPAVVAPEETLEERPSSNPMGKALVVEDNMLIAVDIEQTLLDYQFETVEICSSVSMALEVIANNEINFAVLDVNLGRETSEEVAIELKKREVPFIFATGYRDSYSGLADRFPGVEFASKPVTRRTMVEMIDRCFEGLE